MNERSESGRWRRRTYLAAAAAAGTTLAGCSSGDDATTAPRSTTTQEDPTTSVTTSTRTTTEAPRELESETETTEASEGVVEFDGGDASAFAAALDEVRTTDDAAGFPKGWSTDVVVRDNRLTDTGLVGVPSGVPTGIFVGVDAGEATAMDGPARSGRPHRNVVVAGNQVDATAGPGVVVADTEAVTISENRIRNPGRIPAPALAAYGIGCWHVRDATVTNTTVTVDADDLDAFGWRRDAGSLARRDNRYVVDNTDRNAAFVDLDD